MIFHKNLKVVNELNMIFTMNINILEDILIQLRIIQKGYWYPQLFIESSYISTSKNDYGQITGKKEINKATHTHGIKELRFWTY